MKNFFENEIERAKKDAKATINVKVIGERPCGGDVDEKQLEEISKKVVEICEKHSGMPCVTKSGSTDCNIPMSMGIPAISVGSYLGSGAHTREEKVLLSSIPVGLKITANLILSYF